MKMMTCKNFANRFFSCGGNAPVASFEPPIHSLLDTADDLVVSICVHSLDIRVILLPK